MIYRRSSSVILIELNVTCISPFMSAARLALCSETRGYYNIDMSRFKTVSECDTKQMYIYFHDTHEAQSNMFLTTYIFSERCKSC